MRGEGEGGGGAGMASVALALVLEPAWLLTRTVKLAASLLWMLARRSVLLAEPVMRISSLRYRLFLYQQ